MREKKDPADFGLTAISGISPPNFSVSVSAVCTIPNAVSRRKLHAVSGTHAGAFVAANESRSTVDEMSHPLGMKDDGGCSGRGGEPLAGDCGGDEA